MPLSERRFEIDELKKHILINRSRDVTPGMEESLTAGMLQRRTYPSVYSKFPGVLWAKRGINTGRMVRNILRFYETHENADVKRLRK